jgi:hypothetical protein
MNETGSDSSADRRGKQHRHSLGLALVPGGVWALGQAISEPL